MGGYGMLLRIMWMGWIWGAIEDDVDGMDIGCY
jgi:hypothetical protein